MNDAEVSNAFYANAPLVARLMDGKEYVVYPGTGYDFSTFNENEYWVMVVGLPVEWLLAFEFRQPTPADLMEVT